MIKRVYAKNFRSLAEVDVSLDKLTILVGPNGSGKSNFIDVLRFLSDALNKGLDYAIDERHGLKAIRRWAPRKPYDIEIEVEIEVGYFSATYRIEIKTVKPEADKFVTYAIKREKCKYNFEDESNEYEILNGRWVTQPKQSPRNMLADGKEIVKKRIMPKPDTAKLMLPLMSYFGSIHEYLSLMFFYNIYPKEISTPRSELSTEYPLDSYGKNITSVLRRMQRDKQEGLNEIKNCLSIIVPGIIDIEVKPIGGFLTLKFWHEYEDHKRHEFDAIQESDGTLRVLGILVALFQRPAPMLLAIEEPELTVHPGVLRILSDLIKEASKKRGQVIITTHSPDLISQFDAQNLRIVEMTFQDGTTIGPVEEAQIEVINERLFSSGDLLRIEGLRARR